MYYPFFAFFRLLLVVVGRGSLCSPLSAILFFWCFILILVSFFVVFVLCFFITIFDWESLGELDFV